MQPLHLVMTVVFCFAFVANAELEEPAGCTENVSDSSSKSIKVHTIGDEWIATPEDKQTLRILFEIKIPENSGLELLGLWAQVFFEGALISSQRVVYTIGEDGKRGYAAYFKEGELPFGSKVEYTLKLRSSSDGIFYMSTGRQSYFRDPVEFSTPPEQFKGRRMLVPEEEPTKEKPSPRPRRREGTDPDLKELARA